jgi:aminopeptidase-like protein
MDFPTDCESLGRQMHRLAEELFPICRSMTGPGVRETLDVLRRRIPLEIREIPTGEKAFDWEIPREWRIRDAYVKDSTGNRVVDFRRSNLHVVSGSVPVHAAMPWRELRDRLFSLPERPDWIPYRTSFFKEDWGFCVPHRLFRELEQRERQGPQTYEVCIDSELMDGSLTYGELVLPGQTRDEVLISTHVCHPSLANDNLSGIAVATFLAEALQTWNRRYTYRFLFIPATIGAIAWLSRHEDHVRHIKHGLVLAVLGDAGRLTYRQSRKGDAEIDRAVRHVLFESIDDYRILDFEPFGYDQRQYCSPGFDLPVGCLMRTPNGQYPEYHTSADDLDLLRAESLADSLTKCVAMIRVLEQNRRYRNTHPKCEPQLGRRGLHHAFGHGAGNAALQRAVLWVLNLSDGRHSLLDVAERSKTPFELIKQAADALVQRQLLVDCEPAPRAALPTSASDTLAGVRVTTGQ